MGTTGMQRFEQRLKIRALRVFDEALRDLKDPQARMTVLLAGSRLKELTDPTKIMEFCERYMDPAFIRRVKNERI